MVNFLNLEYFLIAAYELSFTKAAKRLKISQQSLSTHISRLEEELGVELFERTHPLSLTVAGRSLEKYARQMLDLKSKAEKEIFDIKNYTRGELRIGISHTRGRALLPRIIPEYKKVLPGIHIIIVEGSSKELEEALFHDEIDLIVDLLPFEKTGIEMIPLCFEDIMLMIPEEIMEEYFGAEKETVKQEFEQAVDLKRLERCPFLLMSNKNRVRIIADSLFKQYNMVPNILIETENIETLYSLCCKGMGITFYPKMFLLSNEDRSLNAYSLQSLIPSDTLGIGYHKDRYLSRAAQVFIDLCKETVATFPND